MILNFWRVDTQYCDFLRQYDRCVPYTAADKATRPFVGVLIQVNDIKYYAPLTSPKPKHINMKNQLDFLKIDNGILGAINFNNMIPVPDFCLIKVDLKPNITDTSKDTEYKILLTKQRSWCTLNNQNIIAKAERLHNLIVQNKAQINLNNRCCNFQLLEQKCLEYCKLNNLILPNDKLNISDKYNELKQDGIFKKYDIANTELINEIKLNTNCACVQTDDQHVCMVIHKNDDKILQEIENKFSTLETSFLKK